MNVSVIIPVLNEQACVARAIGSAWQAGASEVIVVDGGSTDGTLIVLESQKCSVIRSAAGRGIQLNHGCIKATGEFLLLLHADAALHVDCIDQIKKAAVNNSRLTHGCFLQTIEQSGWTYRIIERGNGLRARHFRMMYGDQGIFVRSDIYKEIGGIPNVEIMEDVLLSRRLKKIGNPAILPGPISVNARRWKKRGPIRQTLFNWSCYLRFLMGYSPQQISQRYNRG